MLDPTASTPLYTQLMEVIERQILTGDRDPGERLPTEGEMAKQFGVSIITVRHAMSGLCEKGLVERKQGKGTFVADERIQRDLLQITSFSAACRQNGHCASTKVISATLEEAEMAVAREQFDRLRDKTRERGHYFLREALQNALVGLFIELANIFRHKMGELPTLTLTRKEELFEQFLRLLFEHCKEQHVVTFYAERLCITPQYLSLILKEQSGKSANKWIDDALIMEAKVLLKAPNATVQQVADALHFSDQSTFGKFFKKHMGISPMEYRKS